MYNLYLGIKDENGNKLYISKKEPKHISTKEYAFEFKDLECIKKFLTVTRERVHTLRDYAQKNNWNFSIEENGEPWNSYPSNLLGFELKTLISHINTTDEEIREEKIRRLKDLQIDEAKIDEIMNQNKVYVSCHTSNLIPFNTTTLLEKSRFEKQIKEALRMVNLRDFEPYWITVDLSQNDEVIVTVLVITLSKAVWERERYKENDNGYGGQVNGIAYNCTTHSCQMGLTGIELCPKLSSVTRL